MKPRPQAMTAAQREAVARAVRAAFNILTPQQLGELVKEPYRDLRDRTSKKGRPRHAR